MQNASQNDGTDSDNSTKAVDGSQASSCASPKLGDKTLLSNIPQNFMPELSGSEDEEVSEVESFILDQNDLVDDGEAMLDNSKFLLTSENINDADLKSVDPETQARLEALLEAAGIGKLSTADGKAFADPEVLRRLTSSVSYALDEAAAALTRMRVEQQTSDSTRSLAEACVDGDIGAVRKMLDEGRSVHETTEEGESLLSLACSAGYYELAQVLLAMRANVEDRGIKGDCTPLMEASSGGYVDIVKLLIAHGADVNAQSSAGNTPLHYASCGGHEDVVKELIDSGANVEEHNENGHTPLMEAASAGHVRVAQILLDAGAGINTHSNEFKESALTLACYKGHLEMVKFLLDAGADQEHKTDEMHTALMEASMDGHVEVARLLLDSGAQVNMPADSFESPLTLAACGGHVDLANLLIERGANLEEVNDEGYTPLMEAAREGHEEMIALLLAHGADINAQTEETQETALTLACCGGFLEVADFLINAGADIELGCSTPLMEAAQEGHLELVKYLLKAGAAVHAQTGTGDTALTYACENGHTDVAEVLLNAGAEMEHESEGGRTPLMKAARAGHLCTVKFLISKGADVNRQTSTNDHTVMSLACAGGHLSVVELLLKHQADSGHKLKDGSTMLIEAAKGGHTSVVNLLLDYPNSSCVTTTTATTTTTDLYQQASPEVQVPRVPIEGLNNIVPSQDPNQIPLGTTPSSSTNVQQGMQVPGQLNLKELNLPGGRTPEQIKKNMQNSLNKKLRNNANLTDGDFAQIKSSMQVSDLDADLSYDYEKEYAENGSPVALDLEERPDLKVNEKLELLMKKMVAKAEQLNTTREEQIQKKQQILKELQRVEQELQEKAQKQLQLNAQRLEQQQQQAAAASQGSKPFQPPISTPFVFPKNINASDTQQALASTVELRKPIPLHVAVQKQLEDLKIKNTSNTATGATGTDSASAVVKFEGSSVDAPMPQGAISSPKAGSQDKGASSGVFGVGGVDSGSQLGNIALPAGVDLSGTAFESAMEKRVVDGAEFSALSASGHMSQVGTGEALFPVIPNLPTSTGAAGLQSSRAGSEEVDLSHVIPRSDKLQPPPPPPLALIQSPSSPAQVAARKKIKPQFKKKPPRPNKQTSSPQMNAGQMGVLQQPVPLLTQPQAGQQTTQIFQQTQTILQKATQQLHQVSLPQGQVPQQQQFTFPQQGVPINAVLDPVTQQLVALNVATTPTANVMGTAAQTNITIYPSASSSVGTYSGLTAQLTPQLGTHAIANVVTTVSGSLSGFPPLQTVTPPTPTMPANSIAGNLDHQQQHTLQVQQAIQNQLQSELKQQTKAQQALKQQLQQELEQQAKLQQERQQLQDQLRRQTQLSQQLFQQQQQGQDQLAIQSHYQTLSQSQVTLAAQGQSKVTLQQQQQMQLQEQQLKLQQMQQQLQQLQLQNKSQQGQLFQAQQITQYQQQVQQQVANAQQQTAQQVSNQQKNGDKPAKKKKRQNNTPVVTGATSTVVATQSSLLTQQNNMINQQFYCNNTAQTVAGFDTPPPSTPLTPNPSPASPQLANTVYQPAIELDAETESNHDTALTLACAGGHSELVSLLLSRGADIEHRDKKGFTPLILAATAGHSDVVEILLDHGADIEAQSERTKDTALSLACSGGRYEVVEILLSRGANKEHRNVSDYTPLSLAASGGYVNIIKLLLSHGAEINSRTGSKLGISPLMLAAMNGHTAAVKLLLDMGSDINAQIETNRNTALTLACFQGRHEVVSLLVDRKANIEHRAKTGLTPLMEAASGGYVEVGRVLLDKGADVNAPPVPSSRDTALTIAADKGHYRFVDLLLSRGAAVDVKNKKGNSPLWLACNGGHLDVCQLLVKANADVDSQDNRKVSCLMAAFRKGHIKVVKWMVKQVTQFPSDPECMRFIATVTDKDLLKKCHQCMEIIVSAKARQAAEANKNASILLEELDQERSREESKRAAAARKREKKKKKKKEKMMEKLEKEKLEKDKENNSSPEPDGEKEEDQENDSDENDRGTSEERSVEEQPIEPTPKIEEEPRISSQPSRGPVTLYDKGKLAVGYKEPSVEEPERVPEESKAQNGSAKGKNRRNKREKARHENRRKEVVNPGEEANSVKRTAPSAEKVNIVVEKEAVPERRERKQRDNNANIQGINELDNFGPLPGNAKTGPREKENVRTKKPSSEKTANKILNLDRPESFNMPVASPIKNQKSPGAPSPKRGSKKEDGWKEVVRNKYICRSKKVNVPSTAISRVIGRGGNHINAIREVSGAHIEIDKQKASGADRIITIKGSAEATRQAHNLIMALIKDPDKELEQIIPKLKNKIAEKQEATAPPQPAPAPITLNISTWDNKMAENIGTTANGNTSTNNTATPAGNQKQSSNKGSSKTPVSSSASTSSSNSNIKTNYTLVKTTNSPLYNIGVFQVPPTTSWAGQPMTSVTSPQRTSQKVTLISTVPPTLTSNSSAINSHAPARSPSTVSRQLFPTEKKHTSGPEKSVPKTTVTYTMASMAKTKMVTSATASFAAKVDNKNPDAHNTKSPGVISRPDGLAQPMRSSGAGDVPQMRPSLTSMAAVTTTYTTQMTVSSPAVYSPFNNIFSSQVAEQFLGKKEEMQENRMNFAQAAAGGNFPSNTPVLQSPASRGPSPPQMAEQDLAKAPGYKGGQRGGSPPTHVMEGDPMKAPGFKGMMNTGSGTPQSMHEVDQSRAPGYRGSNHMGVGQQSNSPRSASSTPVPSHSPRVPPMHGPMMFPPMDPPYMNEYSTPNQPMTLPKIESNLNPNAPDFLSQRSQQIQQYLRSQGQGQPPGMSATPPPFSMGVSRPPVFHTPPPGSAAQATMPLQLAGLPAAMALSDLPGNSISGLPMSAFQGLPRQFGPVPAVGRQVNSSAMLTPSKDTGSPRSAVSETPPMSSDNISPSDGGGGVAGEPKMRPIGTERRQRPMGPSVDSGSMAAMWSNGGAGDMSEWGASVGSVMSAQVSSRSMSLPGDLPDAAASHSAGLPPGVLPAASVYPPDSADQRLDHSFQGAAPLLTAFPNLTMFTNGIPPNAGPLPVVNPLPTGQLGPGPGGGGDTLGRGWNPQVKGGVPDTAPDAKVNWNNWSPANGM